MLYLMLLCHIAALLQTHNVPSVVLLQPAMSPQRCNAAVSSMLFTLFFLFRPLTNRGCR